MNQLMKSLICGAAVVAAGIGLSSTAHAQTGTVPVQYPFAVKLGIAFPGSSGSSGYGNSVFDAGLNYDFGKTTANNPVIYQGYIDYYGKSAASLVGYGVDAKFVLGNAFSPTKPWVGVGVGGYTTHISGSSTTTNFGGKVFAGYDFTQNVFAEVDYTITSKVDGANPDATGLRVGYRF